MCHRPYCHLAPFIGTGWGKVSWCARWCNLPVVDDDVPSIENKDPRNGEIMSLVIIFDSSTTSYGDGNERRNFFVCDCSLMGFRLDYRKWVLLRINLKRCCDVDLSSSHFCHRKKNVVGVMKKKSWYHITVSFMISWLQVMKSWLLFIYSWLS